MTISLSPEAQRLVGEKLKSGAYRSADDVIHAALLASTEAESLAGLDAETLDAIDRAEAQIERGEVHDWQDVRGARAGQVPWGVTPHGGHPPRHPSQTHCLTVKSPFACSARHAGLPAPLIAVVANVLSGGEGALLNRPSARPSISRRWRCGSKSACRSANRWAAAA